MKALSWLSFILSLMTCGTHVGNGIWDNDKDKDPEKRPANSNDSVPEDVNHGAGPQSKYIDAGPWKGLSVSLDASFHEDVSFTKDLVGFLNGKSGSIEEKREGVYVEVLVLTTAANHQILKNKNDDLIGSINSDQVFVYSTEHSTDISSATSLETYDFPDEAMDSELRGAYHVLTSTQRSELSWYQTDADTLIMSIKVINLNNEAEVADVVYRIKKQ